MERMARLEERVARIEEQVSAARENITLAFDLLNQLEAAIEHQPKEEEHEAPN